MQWLLVHLPDNRTLSEHPNQEGCKLTALRHINNGSVIRWNAVPLGFVDSETTPRFKIELKQ